MAFIKAHVISLVCGVAALAFITVAVLGMMSDTVVQEMEQQASVRMKISSLRSSAKNEACIQAEAERCQRSEEQYNAVQEVVKGINAREPLMSGVFPKIERDAIAFNFRDAYREALARLPHGELEGGDLPSPAEIQDAQTDVAELLERAQQEEAEGGPTAPPIGRSAQRTSAAPPTPVGVSTVAGMDRSRGARGGGGVLSVGGPGPVAGAGAVGRGSQGGDPKYDPIARANITKARNIRCYVSTNPARPSFHISPIWDLGARPTEKEMWYAQVGLWVQQDVVAAVAELNDEAAKRLKPEDAHVENMPVKRIEAICVQGYWTGRQPVVFPVDSTAQVTVPGSMEMKATFTGRKCDAQFDVIRFKVVLVVDQRDLQKVIDAVTRKNFYKCIGVSFAAVTPADRDESEGYLYGPAPVVRAVLDFEGYMARNVYEKLFPAEVREALGITPASPQP